MSSSEILNVTLANIDQIQGEVTDLVEITKEALAIPSINDKVINRNFAEFCTGLIERACGELSKDEATTILCEQISTIQGVKGKQLAEFLSTRLKTLDSDEDAINLQRSFSQAFSDIDIIESSGSAIGSQVKGDTDESSAAQRQRFSWAEKMQLFQGQISKLKREMADQQNEIIVYTKELHKRKELLNQQLKSTNAMLTKTNQTGMDAQRFGQIAKGLHAATNFERVDARHSFQQTGSLV